MADEKNEGEVGTTLVVLGLDTDGKAHASRFTPADSEQAIRAARMMNFHAVRIGEGELQKVAAELPIGKIFVTGKGLVPLVKRDLYDKLAAVIGTDAEVHEVPAAQTDLKPDAGSKAGDTPPQPGPTGADTDPWASLRIGATVLAKSVDSDEGWFEAVVSSIAADGNELTLRWRDFTREPVFKRQRRAVGLLA